MSKQPNFRLKEMNDLLEGKKTTLPRVDTMRKKIELLNNADQDFTYDPAFANEDAEEAEIQALNQIMPHNDWFKKFAQQHQSGIDKNLEQAYGKKSTYHKMMSKSGINTTFKQRFSKFVTQANIYRKQNPQLFEASSLGNESGELQDKMKHLTPIKMSPNRKIQGLSPQQKRNVSVNKTGDYYTPNDFNRIKKANYGKWYMKPDEFNKKI